MAATSIISSLGSRLIATRKDKHNMVLKLFGNHDTPCTKTVATVLLEKNIPFELVEISFEKGEHKAPEYLKKQPFGQVPYLDDNGFIIYESRAIARYIEAKHPHQGTQLIPAELEAKALFEQAAAVEQNNFYPYAAAVAFERIFKEFYKKQPDEKLVEEKLEALSAKLDVYDNILSKQEYIAGNKFTLADIFHLAYGTLLFEAGSTIIDSKPNVSRWFREISSRPSWQAVKDSVESTVPFHSIRQGG